MSRSLADLVDDFRQKGEEIAYVEEPGTENPFKIYAREEEPCPRCGTPIRLLRQAGRRTDFCPHCQPARRREG